jgi:hypothetical protein
MARFASKLGDNHLQVLAAAGRRGSHSMHVCCLMSEACHLRAEPGLQDKLAPANCFLFLLSHILLPSRVWAHAGRAGDESGCILHDGTDFLSWLEKRCEDLCSSHGDELACLRLAAVALESIRRLDSNSAHHHKLLKLHELRKPVHRVRHGIRAACDLLPMQCIPCLCNLH